VSYKAIVIPIYPEGSIILSTSTGIHISSVEQAPAKVIAVALYWEMN